MGANQQRNCSLYITIQKNSRERQDEPFDFTKQRIVLHSSQIYFPSYLHYYIQPNIVTYSLLKDQHNVFAQLDFNHSIDNTLFITRLNTELCGKIWKLLRDQDQIQIQEGNFIRLGDIEMEVKEIQLITAKKSMKSLIIDIEEKSHKFQSHHYNNSGSRFAYSRMKESDVISMSRSEHFMKKSLFSEKSSMEAICRFCFDSSSTKINPLLNVCLCAGSVKNIHFLCLKSWVRSKMGIVQSSHCTYYHYEPLMCQLCKYAIKNDILFEDKVYKLFEPERIHPPYARFQYSEGKKVYQIIIRLEESTRITIGRGSQNELNLNIPSIARSHCTLFYTSRRLFLKGKSSKYGTFVQLRKTIESRPNDSIGLLIQNNLISIDIKSEQSSVFSNNCCKGESIFKIKTK